MRVLNGVQYSDINMLDSIHISLHLYKQHKLNRRMSMYRLRKWIYTYKYLYMYTDI